MKNRQIRPLLVSSLLFPLLLLAVFLCRLNLSGISAAVPQGQKSAVTPFSDGRIDINSATAQELMILPGIGEVLAGRILEYRQSNGAFSSPEELLNIKGIGTGTFTAISQYIFTGGTYENTGS